MRKMQAATDSTQSYARDGSMPPGMAEAPPASLRAGRFSGVDASPVHLIRSIEHDVIPRLMLAVRQGAPDAPPRPDADRAPQPREADVARIATLVMEADADTAHDHVVSLRTEGLSAEALFLGLLAPAARRLGELWEEDLCDFTQVTVGLMRLQQILRRLSPDFQADAAHRELGCRILLAPAPGEQHTFGLNMVGEFFRRAGWEVHGGAQATTAELTQAVRGTWFAVIGFSLGSDARLDTLTTLIQRLRRASCNPGLGVMVGGPLVNAQPDCVARLGADATATDGREAVLQAHRLLALLPERMRI